MRRLAAVLWIAVLVIAGCAARTTQSDPPPTLTPDPSPEPPSRPEPPPGSVTDTVRGGVARLGSGAEASIASVAFATDQRGWLIRSDGVVLATEDGGRSWAEASFPARFVSLYFGTPERGWAYVPDGMFTTADGGKTWDRIETAGWPSPNATFVDENHAWTRTGEGQSYATADGGRSWTQIAHPCEADNRAAIHFISPTTGWQMCGSDEGSGSMTKRLFKTVDGGRNWTLLAEAVKGADFGQSRATGGLSIADYVGGLFFLDDKHGWLTGPRYGSVQATTDGGRSWKDGQAPSLQGGSLAFTTLQHGYRAGRGASGAVLVVTRDGGATWEQVFPAVTPTGRLVVIDRDHAFGTGTPANPGAVLQTADGGRTWKQVSSVGGGLSSISFPSPENGWALTVRWEGQTLLPSLFRTADGGSNWTPLSPSGLRDVDWVSFVDEQTGFFGRGWEIRFVTRDGGASIEPLQPEPGWQYLFLSAANWWRLLDNRLFATEDGGATWASIPLDERYKLHHVAAVPGERVWAVGGECGRDPAQACEPVLLSTGDGGMRWTRHEFGIQATRVFAGSGAAVWVTDADGHLYASADGGRTWTQFR